MFDCVVDLWRKKMTEKCKEDCEYWLFKGIMFILEHLQFNDTTTNRWRIINSYYGYITAVKSTDNTYSSTST